MIHIHVASNLHQLASENLHMSKERQQQKIFTNRPNLEKKKKNVIPFYIMQFLPQSTMQIRFLLKFIMKLQYLAYCSSLLLLRTNISERMCMWKTCFDSKFSLAKVQFIFQKALKGFGRTDRSGRTRPPESRLREK